MEQPTKAQLSEAARILKSRGSEKRERVEAAKVLAATGAGRIGGINRAQNLSPERRSEIARLGGQARGAQMKAERDVRRAQARLDALKRGNKS
jgi:general stress protein YciG